VKSYNEKFSKSVGILLQWLIYWAHNWVREGFSKHFQASNCHHWLFPHGLLCQY